jgi:hypothetical protein
MRRAAVDLDVRLHLDQTHDCADQDEVAYREKLTGVSGRLFWQAGVVHWASPMHRKHRGPKIAAAYVRQCLAFRVDPLNP